MQFTSCIVQETLQNVQASLRGDQHDAIQHNHHSEISNLLHNISSQGTNLAQSEMERTTLPQAMLGSITGREAPLVFWSQCHKSNAVATRVEIGKEFLQEQEATHHTSYPAAAAAATIQFSTSCVRARLKP